MKKKILIINADYYPEISENLLNSSSRVLKESNVEFEVINVPGALEIPVILEKYKKNFSGFIIFGCVIRGATSHYDLVVNVTSSSIYKIVNKDKLPLAFKIVAYITGIKKKRISWNIYNFIINLIFEVFCVIK